MPEGTSDADGHRDSNMGSIAWNPSITIQETQVANRKAGTVNAFHLKFTQCGVLEWGKYWVSPSNSAKWHSCHTTQIRHHSAIELN